MNTPVTQPIPDRRAASPVASDRPLYDMYADWFECRIADTDALIDECYRLRYQVYCDEHKLVEPDPTAGEYERDAYDGQSVHALLRYRPTGEYAATLRLIIPDVEAPRRLPAFALSEAHHIKLPDHLYRDPCGEISRFCISKRFRRRVTDRFYGTSYSPRELVGVRNRTIPFMAVGLMGTVLKISANHGIGQAFAMMDPALVALLAKLSIHFTPVGPRIEDGGPRQIAYLTYTEALWKLEQERPDIYDLIMRLSRE